MSISEIEAKYTSGVYTKRPLAMVRGQGAHLWDEAGKEYIDCVGGQGAANVGHANPAVAKAIAEQARTLISLTEIFYNDKRAAIEEKLCAISPNKANRVFLCNSGAEAVEGAIKFARYATGRTGIIAMMRGFHGRTMGALSATYEPRYRDPFVPLVPDFSHIPFDNLEKARAAINEQTAAVIVEVVQGEGGVRPGSREFLRGLQEICRERGAMLIVDEVQTGFARTGKMFASEHFGIEADFVAVAKSIAGGLPMGAIMIGERVRKLEPMIHGSTFGAYMKGRLERIESPMIREVRGMGLMIGIELKQKVTPYISALMERGVLVLPAGLTVLRLLPPLVIEKSDLDIVADQIEVVLNETKSAN